MPGELHQISASYDRLQDRILFSASTQDGTEFRFWITRRYLLLVWSMLGKLATQFAEARSGGDPLAREALSEIAHHEAHRNTNFGEPYAGASHRPLGDDPVLLTKVSIRRDPDGRSLLSLHPDQGPGADLGVDERITHLIASLLQNAAMASEWQLSLAPLTPPAMGEAASSRVH